MIAYLDANRPDWRTEPLDDLVAWTHEMTSVPSDTLINDRILMARLTIEEAGTVFATMDAAAASNPVVRQGWKRLEGDGLDLSHASSVAMITALFEQPLRAQLIALGRRSLSHWAAMGQRPMDDPSRAYWLGRERGNGE